MSLANVAGSIWARVDRNDPSGCWLWLGGLNSSGYGQMRLNNKLQLVHRISYELANGSIPDNMLVLHSCDNPRCVNPAHLRLGTHADNAKDKLARGRTLRGGDNPGAKLTDQEMLELTALYETGDYTQQQLATQYGITQAAVSLTIRRVRRQRTDNNP